MEGAPGAGSAARRRVAARVALGVAALGVVGALAVLLLDPFSAATGRAGSAAATPPAAPVDPAAVVATVDGVPVTAAHLRRAATRLRAEVVAEFPMHGGRTAYWATPVAGRTPHEVLVERSLRAAVADIVLRRWACEAGLSTDPSEAGFRTRLDTENARREAARSSGRPMPGVPRYDEEGFARTETAEWSAALAGTLEVDVSEARLRARYTELLGRADPSTSPPPFDEARERIRRDLTTTAFDTELTHRITAARVLPGTSADPVVHQAE
ncbi:hypothetical protein B4N89_31205 [Embleya scabrispora]|uniref:Uncharacterized protein n=1 Tax=Embleya scabrispora TaxID=159449 RepID=A0A1T3NNW6_9ACTN|nr:hypothetical protein [Embleya scabrispora]OPC78643.1 hypothetical protein B4N89_31205 [Embleya scabrispora]